ncbi:TonB-dependent receptor [bacterium]|nr:TonB-dependent receptor [bacterium]
MKTRVACWLFLALPLSRAAGQTITQVGVAEKQDSIVTIYHFEEIVVWGDRYIKAPGVTNTVSELEIRRRNSRDVADVVSLDPGLTITTGTKSETQTRIRGFNARDVLVLVDGRPINPGYYGKADLAMLPAENIARVKVMKGPASVAYGANGMGGVINIITKNGYERPLTSISADVGPDRFSKVSINHSRQVGRFNYWIHGYDDRSAGFRLSNDFVPTVNEDGGIRDYSDYRKTGANLKIGYDPSKHATYALSIGYHTARKGCSPSASPLEAPVYREFPSWYRYGTALNGSWQVTPLLEIKSTLFADAYHDRFKSYLSREMNDDNLEYDSLLENWTLGGNLDGTMNLGNGQHIRAGMHIRRDLMNKKPDRDEPWYSHHHLTATLFMEGVAVHRSGASLTAGLGAHFFAAENSSSGISHLSPMVSVAGKLPFALLASAGWANAVRFPTMHMLYSATSGNEDLKPEEADKFEIGVERPVVTGTVNGLIRAAVYYNRLKNMIYRASRTFRYENIDEASLPGWEATMRWQYGTSVSLDVSYARVFASGASSEMMEELPEHRWSAQLYARTNFGFEISYGYNRFSARTTYFSSIWLSAYATHDISIIQAIRSGLKLRLRIANASDADFQEELGYPGPGRQIFAGFLWNF